jgi:hypothetical protein
MKNWTPDMDEHTPTIVREAWRKQLFDDLAEQRAHRAREASAQSAVIVGILAGIVGSAAIYLFV